MTVYSAFASSILGMTSQAHSLSTISQNIANVSTGGFKRTETRFQTVLSDTIGNGRDFGGVLPKDVQMISKQGLIYTTARDLDLAIVGDGFFVVSDKVTGGDTFYSRDGSFDTLINTATASTGTGSSSSVPGYIVDKNGYYLMGWAPNTGTQVFPTSGTPTAMRIDPDYFANTFESTSKAELGLNLPAGATPTPAVAQVDTVTLAGTPAVGNTYGVTVNGTAYSYTWGAGSTVDIARDALIASITADTALPVTARSNGVGILTLTADTAGTAFTSSVSATGAATATDTTTIANKTAAAAHAAAVATVNSGGAAPAGYYSYSIGVVDSAGAKQSVRFNFTRTAQNSWQVSATHSQTPVKQVDTVTLGGAVEPGDSYTVTVGGTTYSYTRSGATTTVDTARDALIASINADTNAKAVAASGGTGIITLTAKTAGTAITSSASATNVTSTADNTATPASIQVAGPALAQIDDVTIAGTIEAGDIYSITVNGTTFSYALTATDTLNTARDALIALINADTALPVTASSNGAGVVRLTADAVNTAFTRSASATNIGGGAANTASVATTTANTPNYTTTSTTTIPFTNTGFAGTASGSTVTPPSAISFALTFNGGSTVSFDLDIAAMTQFDSDFIALTKNTNGFEKSKLERLAWDEKGYLVGNFSNENSRRLYRVPLANFVSPDTLLMKSGMVFEETPESGPPKIEAADVSGRAGFSPGAIEQSNVDIAEEFTRMIMTQAAYNANSVAFKTNDELTVTARDLFKG